MSISIGTSGWAYREWQGGFYPPGLKPVAQLAHYVQHFNAVEINSTAYRTPSHETVHRWSATMPVGFTAAVKLSHAITHAHRLRDADAMLAEFIASVRHFGDRRGPVLAQLPPGFAPDHVRLRDFLAAARSIMADPQWPLVIEFRHPEWITERTERLLDDAHASWCLGDMPMCPVTRPTAGAALLYLRRHGTDGRYRGSYDDQALQQDAELLCAWATNGVPVYAFFNNTADGAAVHNARRLQYLVAGRCGRLERATSEDLRRKIP
ncbi:MAG TPA: DUF72 domain-containing protein [Planctomycetota bacterium]|nr:DUF72 domain-containing protein [Planctomycetota bacterium]